MSSPERGCKPLRRRWSHKRKDPTKSLCKPRSLRRWFRKVLCRTSNLDWSISKFMRQNLAEGIAAPRIKRRRHRRGVTPMPCGPTPSASAERCAAIGVAGAGATKIPAASATRMLPAGVPGAAPRTNPGGIGVIGVGSAMTAGVLGAMSLGTPEAVKDEGTPSISVSTSSWCLFEVSNRRTSRVLMMPRAVPIKWLSASSLRPSHTPCSHCASVFLWRATMSLELPASRRWSGLGSRKRTVSAIGTAGEVYEVS